MENEPANVEQRASFANANLLIRIVGILLAVVLMGMVGYAVWDIQGRYARLQEAEARNRQVDLELEEIQRQIQAEELRLLESLKARTLVGDIEFLFQTNNPQIRHEALEFLYQELASEEVIWRRNAVQSLRMLAKSDQLDWAQQHSEICEHLLPLIHDDDPYLAWLALDTLEELRPEKMQIADEIELVATHPGHPLAPKAVAVLLTINPRINLPVFAQLRRKQGLLPWFRYRQTVYFPDPSLDEDPEVKAILERIEADEARMYQRSGDAGP